MPIGIRHAAILATALLAAACGAGPVSQATSLDSPASSLTPSASPASAVATASWVSPADDARAETTTLDLAATVSPPTGVSIGRVAFIATSANGDSPACAAATSAVNGTWSCHADLLASGVAVGPVSFTLKATASDGAGIDTTAGSRSITYAVLPPQPADPTYTLVNEVANPGGGSTQEYGITWTAPKGYATGFLAYGVTDCLRYAKENNEKPCVVRGMKIPKESLELLQQAPGDARSMTVKFNVGDIGFSGYWAVLIRATNDYGDSIFTIVNSGIVCFDCAY